MFLFSLRSNSNFIGFLSDIRLGFTAEVYAVRGLDLKALNAPERSTDLPPNLVRLIALTLAVTGLLNFALVKFEVAEFYALAFNPAKDVIAPELDLLREFVNGRVTEVEVVFPIRPVLPLGSYCRLLF